MFVNAFDQWHPSARYRAMIPIYALVEQGLGEMFINENLVPTTRMAKLNSEAVAAKYESWFEYQSAQTAQANVFLYHQVWDMHIQDLIRKTNARTGHKPIVFLFDTDDNMEYQLPDNYAFAHNGCRDPKTGERLNPGDTLHIRLNGELLPAWVDGETYPRGKFDIAANIKRHESMYAFARNCDAVTTTCQPLADHYRSVGCQNVKIFPNAMCLDAFREWNVVCPEDEVRILWQGGESHYPDIRPIADTLAEIVNTTPNVKMIFYGQKFKHFISKFDPKKCEYHKWEHFAVHYDRLGTLRPDINLAPLVDTEFNRCKSAIKWYEASSLVRPAATLAAAIGPYLEIDDGETGFLYRDVEEFGVKLRRLIEEFATRRYLARMAKGWVAENRDVRDVSRQWVEWVHELLARKRPILEVVR